MPTSRELGLRIVETGVRQWAEYGPTGFSVARIARELGVSTASPYRHFADRDVLRLAVVAHAAVTLGTALTTAVDAAGSQPVARLRAAVRTWVDRTRVTRIGLAEFTSEDNDGIDGAALREACGRPVELVTGLVAAATDTDSDVLTRDVLALLHGYATVPAGGLGLADGTDVGRAAAAAVVRLLAASRTGRRAAPETALSDEQAALF